MEDPPTDVLCFHCQQAVEKYLKAYLTFRGIKIRKTHDLQTLFDLCIQQDKDFRSFDKTVIARLTLCAVEVRYPELSFIPTLQEVKEYYAFACEVKELVSKKLGK
jgi:HEPN domain-containing protein